ncbi:Gfo/Idh/MocA family oxidoreductase [Photobacterium galatheae]|uniref:Oxidoreductase n=1 Tax=Photobacterium galatheae TaxID=1654360 RepID=A0A066RSP2_9GAMM|nr:Gfo/Idh/MocA family oxidoreductase [Photobacterium galatheae]KDM90677.1 hypothetical protein EA58_16340 [Photobacterium galatheae]MCM0150628.1 Gfo/Idh/MocA family oxidoreductase [Photobacterium galatheae]
MIAKTDSKVILVGAGFIADIHARAIQSLPDVSIQAMVDPNLAAAQLLAQRYQVPHCFSQLDEALAEIDFDTAHVLTPPNLHFELTRHLLEHGKHVLVEKPLAETPKECDALITLAQQQGLTLAVNQNFLFHPVIEQAKYLLQNNAIGPVTSVTLNYEMPLRQLDSKQFSHWMFRQPVNLLLEQAVHPLSQLLTLFGQPQGALISRISQMKVLSGHQPCILRLDAMGELSVPFHFSFAMGNDFPIWQLHISGEDGTLMLDVVQQRVLLNGRSHFLPALDSAVTACSQAGSLITQGVRQLAQYAGAITGVSPAKDPFFLSMQTSLREFHQARESQQPLPHSAAFGQALVHLCHQLAEKSQGADALRLPPHTTPERTSVNPPSDQPFDVLVIGGTGFIGRHVVSQLLAERYTIGVMARHLQSLPAFFHQPAIQLIQGDVCDPVAVDQAVSRTRYVINLAHGGGSGDWPAIHHAMVDSARTIAQACLTHSITRLVHVGSIASLYLGSARTVIHSASPIDADARHRAHYARAKAMADELLLHEMPDLDVVVLRPGIVVGNGGLIHHTGIGFFNNSQYFIGWNLGDNPLPFVLAEDVASATVTAMTTPAARGKALNLVGDVRPSAREYVAMLNKGLARPYRYVPQLTFWLYLQEITKWAIKRLAGRSISLPSLRDLKSRAMNARFDTSGEKRLLNWQPVNDWHVFYQRAVLVHRHESPVTPPVQPARLHESTPETPPSEKATA